MEPPKPPHAPDYDPLIRLLAELYVEGHHEAKEGHAVSDHQTQIKLANQQPLNVAAAKFLPPEWQDNMTKLRVLSLMRWGLVNGLEHWLKDTARLRKGPTPEQVESMINRLAEVNPKKAMDFLLDPEETGDSVMMTEDDLHKAENSLEAAEILLETLYDAMQATAP